MSIFPRADLTRGPGPAAPERGPGLERDGRLARPISGLIYLIEEEDLEALRKVDRPSPLSGLVSRH